MRVSELLRNGGNGSPVRDNHIPRREPGRRRGKDIPAPENEDDRREHGYPYAGKAREMKFKRRYHCREETSEGVHVQTGRLEGASLVADWMRVRLGVVIAREGMWKTVASSSVLMTIASFLKGS